MHCFHCCSKIEGNVLRLPYKHCRISDVYSYYGYFCSFECMRTYNLEQNDSFVSKRFALITQLYFQLYGPSTKIRFAPQKTDLDIFGGKMNIEEFRKGFGSAPVIDNMCPVESTCVPDEQCADSYQKQLSTYKPTPVNNDPIKLQRSKPLKNSQYTLENTMGLFKNGTE